MLPPPSVASTSKSVVIGIKSELIEEDETEEEEKAEKEQQRHPTPPTHLATAPPPLIDTSTPESLERDFHAWLKGELRNCKRTPTSPSSPPPAMFLHAAGSMQLKRERELSSSGTAAAAYHPPHALVMPPAPSHPAPPPMYATSATMTMISTMMGGTEPVDTSMLMMHALVPHHSFMPVGKEEPLAMYHQHHHHHQQPLLLSSAGQSPSGSCSTTEGSSPPMPHHHLHNNHQQNCADNPQQLTLTEIGGMVGTVPVPSGSSTTTTASMAAQQQQEPSSPGSRSSGTNQLGRTYSPGLPLSMSERQKIVELHQEGWKICDISKYLCVTHSCVSKILQRFRATGSVRPKDAKEGRQESPLVAAIRDYRLRLGIVRQSEIREQLIRDGLCRRDNAPSRSSINHILRTKLHGLDVGRRRMEPAS